MLPRTKFSFGAPSSLSILTLVAGSGISTRSPSEPNGLSARTSKQVICTLVGVQPTPRFRRFSICASGKALPRTLPERSPQQATIISSRFIDVPVELVLVIVRHLEADAVPILDAFLRCFPIGLGDAHDQRLDKRHGRGHGIPGRAGIDRQCNDMIGAAGGGRHPLVGDDD